MKFLTTLSLTLATAVLGSRVEVFWITSTNGRIPDDERPWTERRAINRFRNTFLVPRIRQWANSLDAEWHWTWYGENTFSPCWEEAGTFKSFTELADYMEEIGEDTPKTMNQGDGSLNHVGYGTIATALTHANPNSKVWMVVWENMVIESIDIRPFPLDLEMEYVCGTTGQISYQQFKDAFKTTDHRLFMINYAQSGALNSYDKVFDSQFNLIPRQFEYMPTEQDWEGSNTNYWNTKADAVSSSMQTFFARSITRDYDHLNFTIPEVRQNWVEEHWPKFVEKYGKTKKSWKSYLGFGGN